MKNIFSIYVFFFLLIGCGPRSEKPNTNKKNIKYSIYFEVFDDQAQIDIKQSIRNLKLEKSFPENFKNITLHIFTSSSNLPLRLSNEDNAPERFKKIKSFFNSLENLKSTSKDIAICKSLGNIIDKINSQEENHIILISNLIENVGVNDDDENEKLWNNGYFKFADIENKECSLIPKQIEAFNNQINDSKSWLSRNVINKVKDRNIKNISLKILSNNELIILSSQKGYDKSKIEDIWSNLFTKLNIQFRNFNDLMINELDFSQLEK